MGNGAATGRDSVATGGRGTGCDITAGTVEGARGVIERGGGAAAGGCMGGGVMVGSMDGAMAGG